MSELTIPELDEHPIHECGCLQDVNKSFAVVFEMAWCNEIYDFNNRLDEELIVVR